eukprot:TRINITY_DN61545_c0_g1_i1.p1 TRINITY_DN61545_c0_g1~~TRINITY_DN61545_c0_g1_i1.p1  ORF type:complete len:477 (-),score=80.40 TRINITY_DN61545_c0_g1_i1:187-1590(-)
MRAKSNLFAWCFAVAANVLLLRSIDLQPGRSLSQAWLGGSQCSSRSRRSSLPLGDKSVPTDKAWLGGFRCSSRARDCLLRSSLPLDDSFLSADQGADVVAADVTSEWGSDALMQRLSPADVLMSSPKFKAVTRLLARIRAEEDGEKRLQDFIRRVIAQMESRQKDLISLWISTDTDVLPADAHVAFDEFLQLFDSTLDPSVQLTRREGNRLEGKLNSTEVSFTLKRCDEPEPWLLYTSWIVDTGPPSLLGMRVVAVDRGPDDDTDGEEFDALDAKSGDVMYLASIERAVIYGIVEWDMLPELTSGFATLIELSDAQGAQGVAVLGDNSLLDMLDSRTKAALNFWTRLNLLPSEEAKLQARQQRLLELTTLTQVLDRAKQDPELSQLVAAASAQANALYNASHSLFVADVPVEGGEMVRVEINLLELIGGIVIFGVVVWLLTQNFGSPPKTDDMPLYSLGGVATQHSQ